MIFNSLYERLLALCVLGVASSLAICTVVGAQTTPSAVPYIYTTSFDGVTNVIFNSAPAACSAQLDFAVSQANKSCGSGARPCISISNPRSLPACESSSVPAFSGSGGFEFWATQWFIYPDATSSPTYEGPIGRATVWASCPSGSSDLGNGRCGYPPCPEGTTRDADGICKPKPCPVSPISPISDPDALAFENGNRLNTDKLTSTAKDVLAGLRRAFANTPGRPTLEVKSAYRPPAYQKHLAEVTKKREALNEEGYIKRHPQCEALKIKADAEFLDHRLNGTIAKGTSDHESGNAFDFVPSGISFDEAKKLAKALKPPAEHELYVLVEEKAGKPVVVHVSIRTKK